ncbi:MAG: hypothetical protein M3133_04545 [Actinomycetota bacterium]|nr:hypothetical protein [Actinomycetota bacterium]
MVLFVQALNVVGDVAVAAALARTLFFEVPVGQARTKIGLYLLVAFVPYALLASLVAPIFARRNGGYGAGIVASHVGRALLASLLIPQLGGSLLYPLGFGLLALSRVHSVSRNSLLPELLGPDGDLLQANSAVAVVSGAAGLAGGGAAFALAAVFGPAVPLLLAAAAFGAGSLAGLRLSPPRHDVADHAVTRRGAGWIAAPPTRRLVAALMAARASLGFTVMLVAFTLHGGASDVEAAVALGLLALGSGVAPFVAPLARRTLGTDLAIASVAALGIVAVATSPVGGYTGIAVLAATVGFFAALARLAFDTRVQDLLPERARGGAYARYETVLQLGWTAGAAAGSLLGVSPAAGGYVVAAIAAGGLLVGQILLGRPHALPSSESEPVTGT